MREDEQGEGSRELLRASGQHLGHGLKWTLSVLLFMLIGAWVDSKVGTSPLVMILGAFIGAGAGGETDEGMVLMESADAGLTWSAPRWMGLGYSAVHVQMIELSDGRLLAVFRRRFLPFGVEAVLSDNQGKIWDTAHPIIVGVRPTGYGGWPTSVELPDGKIVTTRAFMTWPEAVFEITRWRLPGC